MGLVYGIPMDDLTALLQEKPDATPEEQERLSRGEPLAYVIGTQPFLGLTIGLSSRPLIPRPETEWWTEELIHHIGTRSLRVLDLCAGSGAIGLAILKECPNATVMFGERMPSHAVQIQENLARNHLDSSRADIRAGDLFAPFTNERFDIIAVNPPYIPEGRVLDESVALYEPNEALFGGPDGLSLIRRIAKEVPQHIVPDGELWMECDVETIEAATALFPKATIRTDQYGRPRVVVAYY
jgi:release factor glutamine methyltransferase